MAQEVDLAHEEFHFEPYGMVFEAFECKGRSTGRIVSSGIQLSALSIIYVTCLISEGI